MGRAVQASGPASGRNEKRSKKIVQVRIKRKKRKRDLEELHRNVLEAKRAARSGELQHKSKTNFAKVLNNFADKRRENEEENEVNDDKSRKKKSKKICDRLLPEPMLGIYENGAKGREICRGAGRLDEISDARLRGNVLKLLKGEETSPNIKRKSEARTRATKVQDEARFGGKDQPTKSPRQRDEDKCRRRLFEPDDEDEPTKNSFQAIDRPVITDHEIRFSPNVPKHVSDRKEQNIPNFDKSRAHESTNKTLGANHLWGWSPAPCYERLCARISIDNFENKPYQRHQDPVARIQKMITATFLQNTRQWKRNSTDVSKEFRDSSSTAVAKSWEITSNVGDVIYQACTQDSDVDDCSSSHSSATMIGSWHPQNSRDDASVFEKENARKRLRSSREDENMEENSARDDKNGTNGLSSSDVVQKTINSVSAFLKRFHSHNRLRRKEGNMFAMEIDENKRASKNIEELNVCLDSPPREVRLAESLKCIPRKNTMKHVPTILRRSGEHSGPVEFMDDGENRWQFSRQKPAAKILKEHILNEENSILSSLNSFSPMERGSRTSGRMTVSPCTTSFLREANYYRYRTPAREESKELTENRQLDRANGHKSKFNSIRGKYDSNPILSWSEEPEVKLSQENGYAEGLSDRKIEGTSRDFMQVVTVRSNTCRNRTTCQNPQGVMDFQRDLETLSEAEMEVEIGGKRLAFFQRSDRFFDANRRDNLEKFRASFQDRKKHQNREIKARKARDKFSRNDHRDNLEECMRFSSFEFPSSGIEHAAYGLSESKDIAERKFFRRQSKEPKHPVFHDRNPAESTMPGGNKILVNRQIPRSSRPEERASRAWQTAEIESWIAQQQVQGHVSLQTAGNTQRHYKSSGESDKTINGLLEQEHRGIPRKPVVLFRPIEEVRQRSTLHLHNQNSRHHDLPDSNLMRDAVINLQKITFEDKSEKYPGRESQNLNFKRTRRRRSPSPCDRLMLESLYSQSQPPKFLAYEATDGENPQRIPVFAKAQNFDIDSAGKLEGQALTVINGESENAGPGYRRFVRVASTAEELKNRQQAQQQPGRIVVAGRHNYLATTNNNDDATFAPSSTAQLGRLERQRSRRIAVMVPLPSSHYEQTSKMRSTTLSPGTGIDPNGITISAARASATNNYERLWRPAQFTFDQGSSVPLPVNANRDQGQPSYEMNVDFVDGPETVQLPERIQLPDGRIGILLAQNSTRPSQLLDVNHSRTANPPCRINGSKSHAEKPTPYEFHHNDPKIYSQPFFQWNAGYGANEAYHRLTRANGAPDTFTGI